MSIAGSNTRLSLLKTDPEVPAVFGIWIRLPFSFGYIRQKIQIAPDTASDLKLRTITPNRSHGHSHLRPGRRKNPIYTTYFRLDRLTLKFLGTLANGKNFMTNPTSCRVWESKAWANAHLVELQRDRGSARKRRPLRVCVRAADRARLHQPG